MSKAVAKAEVVEQMPAVQNEAAAIFSMIERMASDPNVPIERAEHAFDFYQKVQADAARKAFTVALLAAQSAMEPIRKNANNSQTRSTYATFEALDRAARPIYSKYGFAPTYRTAPSEKPDHVKVILTLMHSSGHERDYEADMPADGKGAKGGDVMTKTHAFGSAFSYGKRYALCGAFNIITTDKDDDGNGAASKTPDAPISEEQLNELLTLADNVGADKEKFCKFYEISSFAEILTSQFGKAKEALTKKGQK